MKFYRAPALLAIFISLVAIVPAFAGTDDDSNSGEKIERSTVVDPSATITLCVMSGTITVRGWDKNELRARSVDVEQIELRRIDKAKEPTSPAVRIDVMVFERADMNKRDCTAVADVEMDVPVGATVQVQTRDGDISIVGVAAAYAGSQNGNIDIERATKLVEAGSVGGSISLKNSSGRINLSSAGGGVEATNIKSANDEDSFEVGTVSGDIELQQIGNRSVTAKTVSGNVNLTSPLVKGGTYSFGTTSGDINLFLPANASFKLNARISDRQPIVSDFPLKPVESWPQPGAKPSKTPEPTPKPAPKPAPQKTNPPAKGGPVVAPMVVKPTVTVAPFGLRRLIMICGDGDAQITVNSFGGTLRIKKL